MSIEEKRRKVVDKIAAVRKIAVAGRLHYLLIASVDVFTGDIQFRTFYCEEYSEVVILKDRFQIEYKNYRIQYSMYIG